MANARNEGVTGNLKPFCVGYANTTTQRVRHSALSALPMVAVK
jgi:hypothetical protein